MRVMRLIISTILIAGLMALAGCATATSTSPTPDKGQPTAAAAATATTAPALPTATTAPPTATPAPAKAAFPLTITDDTGREVTLEKEPQKIVSLAPSNTEILFALGLGPKVVGVTDFCDYPAEAATKPKMGGIKPSLEKIVAAQPDLVLAIAETSGAPEIAGKLEELNVKVIVLGPKTLDDIMASIELVGQATGKGDEAANLVADIKAKVEGVIAKAKTATSKPRVMYELDATDPAKPYTPGPGSFMDALIGMAGGSNIAADAKMQWAQLSLEEVVKKDPEIIILGDANYGVTPDQVKQRPGWSNVTAVKSGNVKPIDDNLVSRPGPRIGDGLQALAKLIHPELFP